MIKKSFFLILTVLLLALSFWVGIPPAASASRAEAPLIGKEILISTVDNEKYLPAVAYNSNRNEYLVVWHTKWLIGTRDIRAQRVSATGQLLGSELVIFTHATKDSAQPSVAYDPINDRFLVTFIFDTSGNGTDWDLYGRLIPWNGPSAGLAAFPIVTWGTSQWNPKVVYAGGIQREFFVVWNNTYTAGTPAAYVSGKRIRPDGSFPSVGADLTLSDLSVNYINPDVSYNLARNEYLVVWDKATPGHDIWGVRITGNGAPLGGGPFGIAGWPDNEENPSVAACNLADQYLVVWQSDVGTGGTDYAIYGYWINGDGTLNFVNQIDNTTAPEKYPDVTCSRGGTEYLVVYQQMWAPGGTYGITGRQVYPNHSMRIPVVIEINWSNRNRTNPVVAAGGTNYLAAWVYERYGTAYKDINGKLVIPYPVFLPLLVR